MSNRTMFVFSRLSSRAAGAIRDIDPLEPPNAALA